MKNSLEESDQFSPDFDKLSKIIQSSGEKVLPAAIQDVSTGEVLLVAWVNQQALELSLQENRAVFYSTSRNEIWRKGESSGDSLELVEIRVNCEQNSFLYLVRKKRQGACHTVGVNGSHRPHCYYRKLKSDLSLELIF